MTTALNNGPYKTPESFLAATSLQNESARSTESWLILRGLLLLFGCLFQIASVSLLVFVYMKWAAGQLYPSLVLQLSLFTVLSIANISSVVLIYSTVRRRLKLSIVSGSGCCLAALCLYSMIIFSSL